MERISDVLMQSDGSKDVGVCLCMSKCARGHFHQHLPQNSTCCMLGAQYIPMGRITAMSGFHDSVSL